MELGEFYSNIGLHIENIMRWFREIRHYKILKQFIFFKFLQSQHYSTRLYKNRLTRTYFRQRNRKWNNSTLHISDKEEWGLQEQFDACEKCFPVSWDSLHQLRTNSGPGGSKKITEWLTEHHSCSQQVYSPDCHPKQLERLW